MLELVSYEKIALRSFKTDIFEVCRVHQTEILMNNLPSPIYSLEVQLKQALQHPAI